MTCREYGSYKKSKNECLTCEYAEYCKEASKDNHCYSISLESIDYAEEFTNSLSPAEILAERETLEDNPEKYLNEVLPAALARCIINLIELKKTNGGAYKILLYKVSHPFATDSDIGNHFQISRQAVSEHIQKAIRLYSEFVFVLNNRTNSILPALLKLNAKKVVSLLSAMSDIAINLNNLIENYPDTFNYVRDKINEPHLSYSQLGQRYNCTKQNIDYHLTKAKGIFSALDSALLVDVRYNQNRVA